MKITMENEKYLCKLVDYTDSPKWKAQRMAVLTADQLHKENVTFTLADAQDDGGACRLRWWIMWPATSKDIFKYGLLERRVLK